MTSETAPKREPELALRADQWLSNVDALATRAHLRPREIAAAFVGREVEGITAAALDTAARRLASCDVTWAGRLLIVARAERSRRRVLVDLATRAVAEARALTAFPVADLDVSAPFGWIAQTIGSEDAAIRPGIPALPLIALWPENKRPWFAFAVVAALRSWAGAERQKTDVRKAAVAIAIAGGAAARRRVAELHAFVAEYEAHARRQEIRAEQALTEKEQAQRQRQLSGQQVGELVARVMELEAKIAQADAELVAARVAEADAAERHASELRFERVQASNALGELTGKVQMVLGRELSEIRLYLDRDKPNVAAALARLRYLEELREQTGTGERNGG